MDYAPIAHSPSITHQFVLVPLQNNIAKDHYQNASYMNIGIKGIGENIVKNNLLKKIRRLRHKMKVSILYLSSLSPKFRKTIYTRDLQKPAILVKSP